MPEARGERPRVVCDADPMARAAGVLAEAVAAVDRVRGGARLGIPGGSALEAVQPARLALGAAWRRVRLTWVDERCVPFADAESNRGAAYRTKALDPSDPPLVELPLYLDGERGAEAVARVESGVDALLARGLDVLLLGMGPEGHIASVFPGWEAPAGARAALIRDSPKPPPERITLTPALLAIATASVLVATGESKRAALERVVAGDPAMPVTALRGLTIVTDLRL
jgi:6-phosphogluconolactonase